MGTWGNWRLYLERKAMDEIVVKLLLLALVITPFVALLSENALEGNPRWPHLFRIIEGGIPGPKAFTTKPIE